MNQHNVTVEQLQHFMQTEFEGFKTDIKIAQSEYCELIRRIDATDLRPGGTVSGPTMMELADTALYVAVLATVGLIPLAVTTNLSINFLRKPAAHSNLRAVCVLHKVGRSQAVGSVEIFSEGSDAAVAHAVGTYAIPPVGRSTSD
jgi:uncharacterized protein (TIGR00369 family)